MRESGGASAQLNETSASLPTGSISYFIAPLDALVIDVHRRSGATELVDFGNSVQVDFVLIGSPYKIAPGDIFALTLQLDSERETLLVVRPDGYITLPRLGTELDVAGLTVAQATQAALKKYASILSRPQLSLSLTKSGTDQLARLSANYEVSRDGKILVPTLGAFDVRGLSSNQIGALLKDAAERIYRNPVSVSATIPEYALANPSISASSETRRYFRETAKVSVDGSVFLPVGGRFEASGKTLSALTDEVRGRLQDQYANPVDVHLEFADSAQLGIFVGGEVHNPGRISFQASMTMMQALATAGWINDAADLTRVRLVHQAGQNRYIVYTTNLQEVSTGQDAGFQDLLLSPRDMVIVPKSGVAEANLAVDLYIRRMLPFGTSVSYSVVNGRNTTIP